jgi:hypothetical protein
MNTANFENIIGYENLYMINIQGEIWSCFYQKIMKQQLNEGGYYFVSLSKAGIKHKSSIHRLLGNQYIPNPENKPCIDHIDRNRTNNSLENLRWATVKENCNNTVNTIALKPVEVQVQRIEDIKQYKANWARWNSLKTGTVPLIPVPAKTRAEINEARLVINMTAEQIIKRDDSNKKYRDNANEEQRLKSLERAHQQRERAKESPELILKNREYQKIKAREYYARKKLLKTTTESI